MNQEVMWVVGQTVIILLAIVASAIRSRERIAKLETSVHHIEVNSDRQGREIKDMAKQIGGVSRHVAEIEGKMTQSSQS